MRNDAAPGPLTQASAPPGVPAKSQISWGGMAPARLGREDPKELRERDPTMVALAIARVPTNSRLCL